MCLTAVRFLLHVLSPSEEAKSRRELREDEEGRTWSDLTARQVIHPITRIERETARMLEMTDDNRRNLLVTRSKTS